MSKMLINESPLMFQPSLAVAIGVNEAIVLQQVHYWLTVSKTEINGHKWVYNTLDQWQEQFPFFSINTVERTLKSLREKGLLVAENLSKDRFTRTLFYRIDYPKMGECTLPQNGEMYIRTETTTENTKHIDAHAEAKPKVSKKKTDTTITEWIEIGGEITDDDPIWERAAKAAIPEQFISIAWFVFKRKATETGRKQKDWKANFRDAVMRDWLKLWAFNSTTGECYLTTAGKTAERELNG
jgi:hypothetical protein